LAPLLEPLPALLQSTMILSLSQSPLLERSSAVVPQFRQLALAAVVAEALLPRAAARQLLASAIHNTHIHTRLMAVCPGLHGSAGTRMVKPIWILLKRQWHQLGYMYVCISLQTDNHASTPSLSFLQARCPSCRPTNSVKA